MTLFEMEGDYKSAKLLFQLSVKNKTAFDSKSLPGLLRMSLHNRDYDFIFEIVERHLLSSLFSQVLLSLAELNRPDLLVDILTQEMPRNKVVPTPSQVTVAIRALFLAGSYERGVELFFRFFEPLDTSSSATEGAALTKLPVRRDAVLAALECCASGGLGAQALRVLSTVSELSRPLF